MTIESDNQLSKLEGTHGHNVMAKVNNVIDTTINIQSQLLKTIIGLHGKLACQPVKSKY